jgi:hypothetical protein
MRYTLCLVYAENVNKTDENFEAPCNVKPILLLRWKRTGKEESETRKV